MNKRDFLGHCVCSWRFNKLKWQIQTANDEQLKQLYDTHKSLPKNSKYQELEVEFQKRLTQ